MPKIVEQRTVWFMYQQDVDGNANRMIEQGWTPLGPPMVLSGLFYQTFVRYSPEESQATYEYGRDLVH